MDVSEMIAEDEEVVMNGNCESEDEEDEESPILIHRTPQEELAFVDNAGKLVASCDIMQGETLIVEKAYLSVPDPGVEFGRGGCEEDLERYSHCNWLSTSSNKKICTSCYSHCAAGSEETYTKCEICSSPMCSLLCSKASNHAKECEILAQLQKNEEFSQIFESENSNNQIFYDFVAVIRFLIFKMESYPTNLIILAALSSSDDLYRFGPSSKLRSEEIKIFTTLFQNLEKYFKPVFNNDQLNLVDYGFSILNTIKRKGLPHQSTENCFSRYFSRLASFISHSCIPNVDVAVYKNGEVRVKASQDILKGEDLVACFVNILRSTHERHVVLQVQRLLDCKCYRCLDPTELGSYIGSVKCTRKEFCAGLLVMMPKHLQGQSDDPLWECTACRCMQTHNTVLKIIEEVASSIEAMTPTEKVNLDAVTNKMCAIQGTVFAGNWLVLLMKKKLINLMGWDFGVNTWKLERSFVNRKLFLLTDLTDIYKKLGCEFAPFSARLQLLMLNIRCQNIKVGKQIVQLADSTKLPQEELKKVKKQVKQIYECFNHYDSSSRYGDAQYLAYKYLCRKGVKFCTIMV